MTAQPHNITTDNTIPIPPEMEHWIKANCPDTKAHVEIERGLDWRANAQRPVKAGAR